MSDRLSISNAAGQFTDALSAVPAPQMLYSFGTHFQDMANTTSQCVDILEKAAAAVGENSGGLISECLESCTSTFKVVVSAAETCRNAVAGQFEALANSSHIPSEVKPCLHKLYEMVKDKLPKMDFLTRLCEMKTSPASVNVDDVNAAIEGLKGTKEACTHAFSAVTLLIAVFSVYSAFHQWSLTQAALKDASNKVAEVEDFRQRVVEKKAEFQQWWTQLGPETIENPYRLAYELVQWQCKFERLQDEVNSLKKSVEALKTSASARKWSHTANGAGSVISLGLTGLFRSICNPYITIAASIVHAGCAATHAAGVISAVHTEKMCECTAVLLSSITKDLKDVLDFIDARHDDVKHGRPINMMLRHRTTAEARKAG